MTTALVSILVGDSNVRALVGLKTINNTTEYKVFPLVATQGEAPPYVVVRTNSRLPEPCKSQRPSMFTPSSTCYCYASSYEAALALRDAVVDALDNKAAGTYNGINLTYLRHSDQSEDWIETNDGHGLYIIMPQFEGQENESYPT